MRDDSFLDKGRVQEHRKLLGGIFTFILLSLCLKYYVFGLQKEINFNSTKAKSIISPLAKSINQIKTQKSKTYDLLTLINKKCSSIKHHNTYAKLFFQTLL